MRGMVGKRVCVAIFCRRASVQSSSGGFGSSSPVAYTRTPQVNEAEVEEAAMAMGYGAVKYADLKNHRTTNYKFSFDDMLNLKVRCPRGRAGAGSRLRTRVGGACQPARAAVLGG